MEKNKKDKKEFASSTESALALKYRPKRFKDLVGQQSFSNTLQKDINRRVIHHSLLFVGSPGTGKTSTARILAKYVNCQDLQENEEGDLQPCNKCRSCIIPVERHPDIVEVNVADSTGVDYMRELVRKFPLKPNFTFKVFILDEFQSASPQAQEMLLKPIEEPPSHVIFILCTTNPEKIKATIRSRLKTFQTKLLDEDSGLRFLYRVAKKEGYEPENKKDFKKILRKVLACGGYAPRASLTILDKILPELIEGKFKASEMDAFIADVLEVPPYTVAQKYLEAVYQGDYSKALQALKTLKKDAYYILPKFLLQYHSTMCIRFMAKEQAPTDWISLQVYKQLDKYYKIPKPLLAIISQRLMKYGQMITGFENEAQHVVTAMTMEVIAAVDAAKE